MIWALKKACYFGLESAGKSFHFLNMCSFLTHRGCISSKESLDDFFSKLMKEIIESGWVARAACEANCQANELMEAWK